MQQEEPDTPGLRWLKSPVAKDASANQELHVETVAAQSSKVHTTSFASYESQNEVPEFERHAEATSAEACDPVPFPLLQNTALVTRIQGSDTPGVQLFFDLFFAANLTVFSEVHQISDEPRLTGYVGFFCLLWFTWALISLFDVRFVADSIFSRIARAGHLGVMIGFAVVAGKFHPGEQDKRTFRTMSICLSVSRFVLAIEYATVIWHVREYKKTKRPLAIMAILHFVCALVYLGVGFSFRDYNTNIYITWFVISIVETLLNIGLSMASDVLTFSGTHLVNRMVLLTFIIIGEGVVVICHGVTNIVANSNSWTPATIGSVTTAVGTNYFVWMLYDDWRPRTHLSSTRQLVWSCLHFPFHLTLVLFVSGSAQFVVWWKIVESYMTSPTSNLMKPGEGDEVFVTNENLTKSEFIDSIALTANQTFEQYPPKNSLTIVDLAWVEASLDNMSDAFWGNITNPEEQTKQINAEEVDKFVQIMVTFDNLIANSMFETFEIDGLDGIEYTNPPDFEAAVNQANRDHFALVLTYAFVAAGTALLLMSILAGIHRPKSWRRLSAVSIIGLGLALTALIALNDDDLLQFAMSPWILPTLCLTMFLVVVINNLPTRLPYFLSRRIHGPFRSNALA